MSVLKRTPLYEVHVEEGGTMVDFGGWEMPVQYPSGIVSEHLYTRRSCSLFDVSHMGRLLVEGPQRVEFLQHVLTSNVASLEVGRAQYCMIPNENGGAIDDAYLYRFEEDSLWLVVNAANTEKDLVHLKKEVAAFDCTLTDISDEYASIAVQGPDSTRLMMVLSGGKEITEPTRNSLNILELEGSRVLVSRTGYTGEPVGYEVYIKSDEVCRLWKRLRELGAKPAGLGARDTLRLEAGLPLYGHEMGLAPDGSEIPIFAVPLARFAVSFSEQKGSFIGCDKLAAQSEAMKKIKSRDYSAIGTLPRRIVPITLLDRGVIRAGMPIYRGETLVGYVTSGTMVPYYRQEGEGLDTVVTDETGKRSIGTAYVDSDIATDDRVEIDVRGRRLKAAIPLRHMRVDASPFAHPVIYQ